MNNEKWKEQAEYFTTCIVADSPPIINSTFFFWSILSAVVLKSFLSSLRTSRRRFYENPWGLFILSTFFVWHTFAIFVFAIPLSVQDPVSKTVRSTLRPLVVPYVNALGQWQDWRVYIHPNPLEYEKRFAIDFVHRGRVVTSEILSIEQGMLVEQNVNVIGKKLLELFCKQHRGTSKAEARLIQRWYLDRANPPTDWSILDLPNAGNDRSLEWYEYTYANISCDTSSL